LEGGSSDTLKMLTGVGGALPDRGRENPAPKTEPVSFFVLLLQIESTSQTGAEAELTINREAVSERTSAHRNTWKETR